MASLKKRGDLFALTGVRGTDPETGRPAASPADQFRYALRGLRSALEDAGIALDRLGRVTLVLPDPAHRSLIAEPWAELFADRENSPARRTLHAPLTDSAVVEIDAVGVLEGTREPIEIDGVRHQEPIPMGVRLGRHVFSSVIGPELPGGGRAEGVAAIERTFDNTAALLSAAGGDLSDVANVWTYLGHWEHHSEMVDAWVKAFPNAERRPARKTFYYPRVGVQLQCDAVIGAPRRTVELDGLPHHDPIPLAAVCGELVVTSGVDGRDPVARSWPRGVLAQARQMLANLTNTLAAAGGEPADLLQVTALVGEPRYVPDVHRAWSEAFGGRQDAPALQVLCLGLPPRDALVQAIGRAVLPGASA